MTVEQASDTPTEPARPYRLGDPVRFTWTLTRRTVSDAKGTRKEWAREQYAGQREPAPREGLVIGARTLSNGAVEYGYEEPTTYEPDKHFRAYLVAYALHRAPVFVLPEDLQHAPPGGALRAVTVGPDQLSLLDALGDPEEPPALRVWGGDVVVAP